MVRFADARSGDDDDKRVKMEGEPKLCSLLEWSQRRGEGEGRIGG